MFINLLGDEWFQNGIRLLMVFLFKVPPGLGR